MECLHQSEVTFSLLLSLVFLDKTKYCSCTFYLLLVCTTQVLFARADWRVWNWLESTIHLRAAGETKSRVNKLISDIFGILTKTN